ncbi:thioesterase family protein [Gordonia sinesedis]
MDSAYYIPIDPDADIDSGGTAEGVEYFTPTPSTASVWDSALQHGGPPSALLMRSMLRLQPDPSMRFTRVTVDILGAVGFGVNRVRARVLRPGKQIAMLAAELDVQQPDGGFRTAARASAWLMRTVDSTAITRSPQPPLVPVPNELERHIGVSSDPRLGVDWGDVGFIGTLETAPVDGRVGDTPALWLRPAIDLVEGEPISDLESIFTVIDVANGLGTRLRPDEWTWMNTDTTVHLTTVPRGPWLGIDSDLASGPDGFGATFADLYDTSGFIGRSAQTVLLAPR